MLISLRWHKELVYGSSEEHLLKLMLHSASLGNGVNSF